ncbi:MAG: YbaN family protein [Mucinivorans sp.]
MHKKPLLYVGFAFVGLAFVGVVTPMVPTTPFLLVAVWCFMRSEPRYKQWLVTNRYLDPYISGYFDGKGLSRKRIIRTLVLLWATLTLSGTCFTSSWIVRAILFSIGIGVSVHIVMRFAKPHKDKD